MPKYSRKDFLIYLKKITGDGSPADKETQRGAQAWLSTTIKRKRIVEAPDKTIDTNNPTNKAFIAQYWIDNPELAIHIPTAPTKLHDTQANVMADAPHKPLPSKKETHQKIPTVKDLEKLDSGTLQSMANVDLYNMQNAALLPLIKIIEEILNKRSATELNNISIAKKMGELIPTEDVKTIVSMFSRGIMVACENEMSNYITDVAQKYNMSSVDVATYRSKIPDVLNRIIEQSIAGTQKDIENLIEETADLRGKGEKIK